MERKRKIIAALADLRQDIAGIVPVDIISKWNDSAHTAEAQTDILRPYERSGFLVSSDSSGLSRLTGERTLLEVMNIVSIPKEVIYSVGSAVGGRGVGVWAADNTEMYYDDSVGAEVVVEAMAAAQKRLHQGVLQVGMGIHRGVFWEIGGGMFGEDAELLQSLAENQTSAKEIVVSDTVRARLGQDWQAHLARREDLDADGGDSDGRPGFYSLNYDNYGARFLDLAVDFSAGFQASGERKFYPFPFGMEFFLAMKQMETSAEARAKLAKYCFDKTVILIKIYHPKSPLLLNQLTDWVVMNALLNEIAVKYSVRLVKSNGDLGIFVADSQTEAVEFAEDVILSLRETRDLVSIGLAAGEILLFGLDQGGMELAGGPVNIASKISEDVEERDSLYVHESVQVPAHHLAKFAEFEMGKSGVTLRGLRYIA